MGTEAARPGRPGLTINIYRVDPVTLARTPVSSVSFGPSDDASPSPLVYPPCRCVRCKRSALAVAG
jgi:hypothetical protein